MAETDAHRIQMTDALIYPLKEHFRNTPDVYVSGNLLIYYEEGNPRASVAPDVFVVFGVPDAKRPIYKIWEEKKAPSVVFELTSKSTRQYDLGNKRFLYEELGVTEYFLFDPLREYLRPPLQGFRLIDDYYMPLTPTKRTKGEWQLHSEVLELTLHTEGDNLRLFNPQTNRYLLMPDEEAAARRAAENRATEAEAEIARLRALLDQLKKD